MTITEYVERVTTPRARLGLSMQRDYWREPRWINVFVALYSSNGEDDTSALSLAGTSICGRRASFGVNPWFASR